MPCLSLENSEDFFLPHDEKLLTVDLDFGSGILAEKHTIASSHIQREDCAFVVRLTFTDGHDFAFLGLFFSTVRNDDSASNSFVFFYTTDENAVVKGSEGSRYRCRCHCFLSFQYCSFMHLQPGQFIVVLSLYWSQSGLALSKNARKADPFNAHAIVGMLDGKVFEESRSDWLRIVARNL